MQPGSSYWFAAKRYGWGWSIPRTWQGWVVLATFLGLLIAGTIVFAPTASPIFYIYVAVLVALLLGVCWLKGEPLRWRWGNDERT
jgi:drug/metabolite transporter (DMT)-like permease